jgi:hypothetical protein
VPGRAAAILLLGLAWPAAAAEPAPSAPATAEQMIAAYERWYEEATDGTGLRLARRCPREAGGEDAIIVCGRNDDARMRVPYEPEPGARVRLIAGEAPSAVGALGAGGSPRGGGVDVIALVNALGRGLDRILHPD